MSWTKILNELDNNVKLVRHKPQRSLEEFNEKFRSQLHCGLLELIKQICLAMIFYVE